MDLVNTHQESLKPGRENSDFGNTLDASQTLSSEPEGSESETAGATPKINGALKDNKEHTPHPRIAAAALNFAKRTQEEKALLIEGCLPKCCYSNH